MALFHYQASPVFFLSFLSSSVSFMHSFQFCQQYCTLQYLLGQKRREQFCRRPHLHAHSSTSHILFFYICVYMYSASVWWIISLSLACLSTSSHEDNPSMGTTTLAQRHFPSLILFESTFCKHECDFHILHFYHENTTHITSLNHVDTCTDTTEALNQVNVLKNRSYAHVF